MQFKKNTANKLNLKVILTVLWSTLTLALIVWWWIWALALSDNLSPSYHRMIKYEGATLIAIIIAGSIFLITYIIREHQQTEKLKLFFSVFTHDIKTSISRLKLQAELITEEMKDEKTNTLRFKNDLARLDLQLENSLLLTHNQYQIPFYEKIKLSDIVKNIKPDFESILIQLNQDVLLKTDKKWFLCVLRNLLQNSCLHGQATEVIIDVEKKLNSQIQLTVSDNGQGLNSDSNKQITKLGSEILSNQLQNSNGVGLYLTKILLKKMKSDIQFKITSTGHFKVILSAHGELL